MRALFSILLICGLGLTGWLAGCERKKPGPRYEPPAPPKPVLAVASFPRYAPNEQARLFAPLIDYLNRRIPEGKFEFEGSRDYAKFEQKYREGGPAIIRANPLQTLDAMNHGYEIVAMAGEPTDFVALILVRKDSGINRVEDLRGKRVAFGPASSLGACMLQQYRMHQAGLDIRKDIEGTYVGSLNSVVENVCLGKMDAACSPIFIWRHFLQAYPERAKELDILWRSEPLVNNAILVRKNLPLAMREAIRTALLEVGTQPERQSICDTMDISGFLPATDADYAKARVFIDRFEAEVRKVNEP